MSAADDLLQAIGQLPIALEKIRQLENRVAELEAKEAHNEDSDDTESIEEFAERTGRNYAAAHKYVTREEQRQAAGKAPRFAIIRNGRGLRLRGAP